jgi:hypothetical protein
MWPQPRRSSRKRSDIRVMHPIRSPSMAAASYRAVREMQNADMLPKSTKLRSSKYLNNLVEQDHRGIKSRTRPMLGFKNFNSPPPSPLPESNCFTVSARDSSHSVDSNSKIKLRRRSGTQSLLHKSHLSSVPHYNHFTYLHRKCCRRKTPHHHRESDRQSVKRIARRALSRSDVQYDINERKGEKKFCQKRGYSCRGSGATPPPPFRNLTTKAASIPP